VLFEEIDLDKIDEEEFNEDDPAMQDAE